jgi:hypothetical protein
MPATSLLGVIDHPQIERRLCHMQLAVRLDTSRDYAIAAVALALLVIALLFTANSVRTTVTTPVG